MVVGRKDGLLLWEEIRSFGVFASWEKELGRNTLLSSRGIKKQEVEDIFENMTKLIKGNTYKQTRPYKKVELGMKSCQIISE